MKEIEHVEQFHATARGRGWPTSVAITNSEWEFQIDEPKDEGGSNSGPNPMHHFVASLAGCQNEQAQVIAEELGFEANQIDFTLEMALNLAGFIGDAENSEGCFQLVHITAAVSGISTQQAAALGARVDARCPILSLLRSAGTDIKSSWTAI